MIQLNLDDIEAVLERANDDVYRVSVYEYREALNAVYRTAMRILSEKMVAEREIERLRVACDGCADSLAKTGSAHYADCPVAVVQTERDEARAEIEMLRGVGCREAKEGEPESGPCGVCLKCAEQRGAKWAIAQAHREVCFAVDQERAAINVRRLTSWEVCRDARRER